ncbi:MAG: cytochrome c oxidase subunit II [Fimbriimonadaceae bacterium]|nr:cytochrome c oxidase subunit II [Alphaproteobacteria bacterium]
MKQIGRLGKVAATGGLALIWQAGSALAEGQPEPWQIGFQDAASPNMHQITWMHNILIMPIITVITIFVAILLGICIFRYNRKANPTPSRTTHNTMLEVLWTIVPILILVVIAIPSFRLLYYQRDIPPADMTIKAIGNQWYWSYEYPDHDNFSFDSLLIEEADLQPGQPRLLAVDNEVVVPVGKVVRMLVTASDVIHNWAMPSFGIKMDGVPGRINETWFQAERTGVYYGQCSELCGSRHAYMPIAVRVVTQEEFDVWVEKAKEEFAAGPGTGNDTQLASISTN